MEDRQPEITVIGGGLAGCEAAWQIAQRGVPVRLVEMRPQHRSPAHHTPWLAELVCSNSLRSNELSNAAGLLKEEMRRMGSIIMRCADRQRVPAGSALAVDREGFSRAVTDSIESHPLIGVERREADSIDPERITVVASGPLTSPALSRAIQSLTGKDYFYFFDAAAPIVTLESLDLSRMFWASRYGKGEDDYLNAPMDREQYQEFLAALLWAERHYGEDAAEVRYFEGCMPVEVMGGRGPDTLRFGPMKPVGLTDPRTGKEAYAVVQLRRDNLEGTLLNLVGFQTQLKWPEQERVFRMIPGLQDAEFVRLGVIHRNSYLNSPQLLLPTLQMKDQPRVFFAGQITGVEGYIESAATGLLSGINATRLVRGEEPLVLPPQTAHGALCHYITSAVTPSFQPMNIAFGLLQPLDQRVRDKRRRNQMLADRALATLENYMNLYKMACC
ncbi:MAG: methylenetetrahydrofolate--tRNA-(uracil(54)-C(5))-methyltransferase (FADH(2)-oxidizing) TrmFO [Firmicutes bacterium]|nr:methylenetetrahydrofolate--tRNA-(uracil(54)-C(5))-methyltransferase (FADH(2)-oxidizing) TrmFO [Bacillota bacterium]